MLPGEAAQAQDFFGRDVDLRRLWKALLRRRTLFLAVFGGFVGFVMLFTALQPKQYTTSVKLIAGAAGGGDSSIPGGTQLPILNALLAANGVQSSETYAELLQQTPVAEEVARNLHLRYSAGTLLSHLKVKPVSDTSILTMSCSWSDAGTAANICNGFASVFVDHERQLVARQADTAITFLQKQIPEAQDHAHAAANTLAAYEERVGIADLPTQTTSDITNLAAIDAKRQQAEVDAQQAAAQLETVEAELAQTPQTMVGTESVSTNPVSSQLESQISTLKVQLNSARAQYTDDHPTVIALKAQLVEAERELNTQPKQVLSGSSTVTNPVYQQLEAQAATLQSTIASAQAQQATLDQQRAAAKPALDNLPEQSKRIGDLTREAKAQQDVLDALQRKLQDAKISKTTAVSDVTITQQASADNYTVKPNVVLNLALALALGLALAISAVFISEFFDDRFRTEDDVKERLGLPVLATIPQFDPAGWQENAWVKPLSIEAFYQLVAALRYSSNNPPRTIAFTSPDQGDGKSTIAVNTAISMSLMKAKVLVVDADLRRPSVHQKLNVSNDRGLSDVLVGLARFPDVIKSTEHAGVWVLTSGRPAPNPVGLLQSGGFDRLLKRARERFDFVVIDGPALRSIVDGVVLGIKAEGTVLVISSPRSEGRSVAGALQKLRSVASINLLGVVLNGTKPDARDHSDYYLGAGQSISLPAQSSG
jgi:capsular exopolysaccharide synthesis family protein